MIAEGLLGVMVLGLWEVETRSFEEQSYASQDLAVYFRVGKDGTKNRGVVTAIALRLLCFLFHCIVLVHFFAGMIACLLVYLYVAEDLLSPQALLVSMTSVY